MDLGIINSESEMNPKADLGPLSLLPIEMWHQVLERVDCSKDIRRFCQAWDYPNWDELLHFTKPSWLFEEIFPLLFPYLQSKEQVLVCRLVCKKWNRAVDQFLESNLCHRPSVDDNDKMVNHQRMGTFTKSLRDKGLLHSTPSPQKMAKLIDSTPEVCHRNPIIGRSVHPNWSDGTENASLITFLAKFGSHIWDFRVEINEASPLKLLQTLQKYLKLLPNLKRLEVFAETTLVLETIVEENVKQLQKTPVILESLPHLETLDITVFAQYQVVIRDLLLNQYAPFLRRLAVNSHCISPSLNLQKLTELSISVDSDQQVDALVRANLPNLQRVSVFILRNSNRGSYPNFTKIFEALNSFSKALFVSVEFPVTYSPIQWSSQGNLPALQLPHLKTLELKEATFHSFSFLCQLPSLEYLHLVKYRWGHRVGLRHHYGDMDISTETDSEREALDLKRLLDDPATNTRSNLFYQSNLWTTLPRLKVFTLSKATPAAAVEQCYRRH